MNLSEFIKKLQEVYNHVGDAPVYMDTDPMLLSPVQAIEVAGIDYHAAPPEYAVYLK